jgi:D-alanine-D-alanine ligase
MKIGITYDLKADVPAGADVPDDFQEEFDSPATIEAIAAVLRGLGHQVEKLGDGRPLLERLLAEPPEFVFNFAEGEGVGRSREARVPAVLEMLGIPYTGSDPLTLAVTLDKDCAKRLVASARVAVPNGVVLDTVGDGTHRPPPGEVDADHFWLSRLTYPVIVKPAWEGSSKGIHGKCSIVESLPELYAAANTLYRAYGQPVLAEDYIEGEEWTVGVIGNAEPQVIGLMRVSPRQTQERFVYGLEVKRDWQRQVRYEVVADPRQAPAALDLCARVAYRALGCRDVARIDFRVRDRQAYFLEANPLPGLNPQSSDLVIMARLAGWTYERLIGSILEAALERTRPPLTPAATAV